MPITMISQPLRRIVTPLITRMLRKRDKELAEKKHPERKKVLAGAKKAFEHAIAKRRYNKKQQFEKKFPTKTQRIENKKKSVQAKKEFKLLKKTQKERYESDPIYRMGTVPRQQLSDTQITWSLQNPLLPGFRRGLRKEAKYGSDYITRKTSSGVLKKMSDFVESGQKLHKYFTPKGRKWLKKRTQEDARAKSILTGDV